jgi:hypothetical protein
LSKSVSLRERERERESEIEQTNKQPELSSSLAFRYNFLFQPLRLDPPSLGF